MDVLQRRRDLGMLQAVRKQQAVDIKELEIKELGGDTREGGSVWRRLAEEAREKLKEEEPDLDQ